MNEDEREILYWLVCQKYLGAVSIMRLYGCFGSFRRIFNLSGHELASCGLLSENQRERFIRARCEAGPCREEYRSLPGKGIKTVTFLDEEYPRRLKEISAYPPMLLFKGHLPSDDLPSVAIVGARACSRYGEEITAGFAQALAAEDVQIISGLALGIDAAAHRGAMKAEGGCTFGVMGCSISNCYPSQNYALYENMQKDGGVLTEFGLCEVPLRKNFPMRNRIISGLADAVLVTEAREKSGSLITARYALDQGREVFALPGRVTDALSKGPNALIADGARPALEPADILEFLGMKRSKKLVIGKKNIERLAKNPKLVYACLGSDPKHLDEIVADSALSAAECLEALLQLQLDGYVNRTSGQYYSRKV